MAGAIDNYILEQKTGKEFATRVKRNLSSSIKGKVEKKSGTAFKSTVRPVFKNELLERITIFTPYYIYPILHMGFEGSKKDGVNFRVKARNFLTDALENGKLVEDLATIIGNHRAEAIVSRINFSLRNSNTSGNE